MALNRKQLQSKLGEITSVLLTEKGYISFVDVFMKLGYLDPKGLWTREDEAGSISGASNQD